MIIELPTEKYASALKAFFCADKQTLKIVGFLVVVQVLGIVAGLTVFPHGYAYQSESLFHKFITWDGLQYISIATKGYTGAPAYCAQHFCNIAFFPLQGLIDKVFIFVFGQNLSFFFIFLSSWCFGLLSIFFFARLARAIMGDQARSSIFLYALYPASGFYLMGYPTGLLSLLIILSFHKAIQNKWWQAALCIGLGTATAPTMVFAGFPLGAYYLFYQLRQGKFPISVLNILGWGIAALSGLILFMVFQYFAFGSTLAFITGQQPWGVDPTAIEKLKRLTTLKWYFGFYEMTINWATKYNIDLININPPKTIHFQNMNVHPADFFEFIFQSIANLIFFALALVGVISAWFFCKPMNARIIICVSGCCALLGYMWFMLATNQGMTSTIRLIFPAVSMFFGLGGLSSRVEALEYTLFPIFTLFSFLEVAYTVSGYSIM